MSGSGNEKSSTSIRSIRRKKSTLTEVKIAILGAPGVGKSGKYIYFIKVSLQLCSRLIVAVNFG